MNDIDGIDIIFHKIITSWWFHWSILLSWV